ncbi:hypothetical protein [Salmonella phage SSBI34]|nr:hypothetical protein [Salmonella phage SSBI34]
MHLLCVYSSKTPFNPFSEGRIYNGDFDSHVVDWNGAYWLISKEGVVKESASDEDSLVYATFVEYKNGD